MKEMPDNREMIGKNIKRFRTIQGMSQFQLAELLWLDRSSLSAYETGKRIPDIFMLCRIADIFDITLDILVGRNTDRGTDRKEMLVEKKNL